MERQFSARTDATNSDSIDTPPSTSPTAGFGSKVSRRAGSKPVLLVSVKDADEARLALAAGVAWIDLKDPAAGALGAPCRAVALDVAEVLQNHAWRSVAAGELNNLKRGELVFLAEHFPVVKVGLAGMAVGRRWRERLLQAYQCCEAVGATLVPAAYADAARCEGPEVDQVLDFCVSQRWPFLLIDTAVKDGRGLLHWLSMACLGTIVAAARHGAVQLVLAGSLTNAEIARLRHLDVLALGVRGGVCGGPRSARISPGKLRQLMETFSGGV